MKKFIALLLALVMVMSLAACSVEKAEEPAPTQAAAPEVAATEAAPAAATEITLWTYPIGGWGNQETVDALMAKFEADTGIKVNVDYLTYADGDDKVNTAIEGNAAPDLIMEGPERLVANWGAKGKMVNIADLYDDTDKAEINAAALAACFADEATAYEYPLVMTAHCMAINKTVFEAAGAMQYIDEATRTWTTEGFLKAVQAVYDYTGSTVGAVYCAGQGGDQALGAFHDQVRSLTGSDGGVDLIVTGGVVQILNVDLNAGLSKESVGQRIDAGLLAPVADGIGPQSDLNGLGSRVFGRSGILGRSRLIAAAASHQRQGHSQTQQKCGELLHNIFSSFQYGDFVQPKRRLYL